MIKLQGNFPFSGPFAILSKQGITFKPQRFFFQKGETVNGIERTQTADILS